MSRYVDPQEILDPNAKPLTKEETDFQMQDSFRTGRQFIRTVIDPILPTMGNYYLELLIQLRHLSNKTEKSKDDDEKIADIYEKLGTHFSKQERPVEAICFHLFKEPVMITGKDGKQAPHYGWAKLRGEFATFGDMELEVRALMQDHDCFTRTFCYPKGTFFPITTAELTSQEEVEHMYDQDIARVDDMKQAIIAMERKREAAMLEMQKDAEPGSLEDYIKQKVRFCVSELKVQKCKVEMEKFIPILKDATNIVNELETKHPNYYADGLALYQAKMEEIGMPKPSSFYDGSLPNGF